MEIDEIKKLLETLPEDFRDAILEADTQSDETALLKITEIVIDLGQYPLVRYHGNSNQFSRVAIEFNDTRIVEEDDLRRVVAKCKNEFKQDNRTGINGTLHRISALVDRYGIPCGLTLRVGRSIPHSEWAIADLIEQGQNILIVAPPAYGKTCCLRGAARFASTELGRRTIIVDESDEIAGFGRIPHPCVGRARKISVPLDMTQDEMLLQAVSNHSPEVIIADEIGNEVEVNAILSVANRGVQIIATAHGTDLESVIKNPVLCNLLGGIKTVTLTDAEAMRRGSKKSVQERQAPAAFASLVIIKNYNKVEVYHNLGSVLDDTLNDKLVFPEIRNQEGSTYTVESPQKVDSENNTRKWRKVSVSVSNHIETTTRTQSDQKITRGKKSRSRSHGK